MIVEQVKWEGETDDFIQFRALGENKHYPGRAYMSNGDPGYPSEDEWEVTYIELLSENIEDEEKVKQQIIEDIYDGKYQMIETGEWV